ncbi:hypothetical protein GIB67_023844, partial [Kingdonia uniflora]
MAQQLSMNPQMFQPQHKQHPTQNNIYQMQQQQQHRNQNLPSPRQQQQQQQQQQRRLSQS